VREGDLLVKYLRVSLDDGNAGDSDSIEGQRAILDEFIANSEDFKNATLVEIADDGYSGTNFERPGIRSLLEKARLGEVACIMVKDFSRFGRNYIDVGDYAEQIFPFLRVRFVSVCDAYDSERDGSAAGNMDFAFKNLLNDYYSKDLSRKCKAGIASMHKAGKYHSGITPYGYMKPKGDIHRIVPDEAAAVTVRRIFAETLAGRRPSDIAKALNAGGVPTPAKYKAVTGAPKRGFRTDSVWTSYTVGRILRDIRYTGLLVQGMHRTAVVGSKTGRRVPESEWVVSPVRHEAIVSEEDFAAVRALLCAGKNRTFPKGDRHMLAGKVICAGCGHSMLLHGGKKPSAAFYCTYKAYTGLGRCAAGVKASEIEAAVIRAASRLERLECSPGNPEAARKDSGAASCGTRNIVGKINALQKKKILLYTEYADGSMEKDEYLFRRDAVDADIAALQTEYAKAGKISFPERTSEGDSAQNALEKLRDGGRLTREIADALIARIVVDHEKNLKIEWRFESEVFGDKGTAAV
jgi:DNA invertase Pin-like site-specific DNA recombinase